MNPAIPIAVNGVAIDYLAPRPDEAHLAAALAAPPGTFIDAARLVYMKLRASRMQDRADIVALVKTGLDVDACRAYLSTNAPALVTMFDDLVAKAVSRAMSTPHPLRSAQRDVAVDPADRTVTIHARRTLGQWRGQVYMSEDFDAPLPAAELSAWLERS